MTEDERKHLDYLQAIITRMNTNSFQVKGLCITIITALSAVFAANQKVVFLIITAIPTLIFWFLDSFYLQQERKFRGVYNDVAGLTQLNSVRLYEMPIQKYKGNGYSFIESFFSKTMWPLYFILLLIIIGSSWYLLSQNFTLI